jgi:serine/threonine protein kinase
MIGRLLDQRYRVVSVLGQGGFGHTYIAEDTRRPGNPSCVVKQLKPATSDTDFLLTARRLFNSEAETLEKLGKHDQIPQLLAYFEQDSEFFLVQEFIAGHPLSKELTLGNRLNDATVTHILVEVLSVLEFVHSNGVIHRDIKPDNLIRRSSDNKLVLVDFGAVKQVKMHSLTTQEAFQNETVAIGTPGYMPSEQGQGRPRPSSDIYALGMIGIQALTGLNPSQLPEDPQTGEVLWRQYTQSSEQLTEVLSKMVRHYFKYRYQTASDALSALAMFTHPGTPKALANALQIKGQQYIKQVYVHTISVLQSLQEKAKTIYIPTINTNPDASIPTITAPKLENNAPPQNTVTIVAINRSNQTPVKHTSPILTIKIPYKSPLIIVPSGALVLICGSLLAANRQPQAVQNINQQTQANINNIEQKKPNPIASPPNQVKEKTTEQANNCVVVTSSSNIRTTPGRSRTGKVIKAGTKATVTGKENGGWIEISSPEQGWIWKSRTKNTCQSVKS